MMPTKNEKSRKIFSYAAQPTGNGVHYMVSTERVWHDPPAVPLAATEGVSLVEVVRSGDRATTCGASTTMLWTHGNDRCAMGESCKVEMA